MEKIHYSSKSNIWETPQEFFDMLDKEFAFTIDVCATKETAKCKRYYTPIDNGLEQIWQGRCWMNPPYGREIIKWMEKAYKSAISKQATVVCLVPARTDTVWWQKYASKGDIWFIPKRLKFKGGQSSAPFPSAIIVFRPSVLTYNKQFNCGLT